MGFGVYYDRNLTNGRLTMVRGNFERRYLDYRRNANGIIDDANFERLAYYWNVDDSTLRLRLYNSQEQTLVNNVTSLRFRYFDSIPDALSEFAGIFLWPRSLSAKLHMILPECIPRLV